VPEFTTPITADTEDFQFSLIVGTAEERPRVQGTWGTKVMCGEDLLLRRGKVLFELAKHARGPAIEDRKAM
jgi:hypothetical protein